MADEDEELSYLRAPDLADVDLTEETQDFRFLDKLIGENNDQRTLPKRGEKDFESHNTNLQLQTLEESRHAMYQVLSWPRTHTTKAHVLAMYDPESNMAYVEKAKTQHFQTMGVSKGGKEWLLPEEALFLLERGTMDCRWPFKRQSDDQSDYQVEDGAPMSLQAAYNAFIGFEGGVGGKLTLEMYNVYAGLRRSGYLVFRTGTWNNDRGELFVAPAAIRRQEDSKPQLGLFARHFTELWYRLSQPTYDSTPKDLAFGPLIKPGLYRSHKDIYRLLCLVQTHDRNEAPSFCLSPASDNPFRIHFDVYRGAGKFRKTARGPPDFRICVVDARSSSLPTNAQLGDLMAQIPDSKPKDGDHHYQKLKHGCRNVILAIVDNGIPSYITIADSPFEEVKIYDKAAPRGKGSKGRGGRGRGRGRGRGG